VRNLTRIYFGNSVDQPLPAGGGGSPWARDGSTIYYNGGDVAIGTSNPSYPLHVKKNENTWIAGFHNTGPLPANQGLVVRADGGDPLLIQKNTGSVVLRVKQSGSIGVGTNAPAYTLDVTGDIRATGSVYYGGTAGTSNGTLYTKPDFVFETGYRPLTIDQVEDHLRRERSLPWMTSAREEKGGTVNMTRMSFETVETAENLQLQVITLNRLIRDLREKIESQERRIRSLEGGPGA